MATLRRADARGTSSLDWLQSAHTFSFSHYHDPAHMGYGSLRVINDDRVAPGGGFATHGHRDMEIISYVLAGALEHKDSIGNGSVIRQGDVQRMSAGTGIRHSEFNHSRVEPVHFLQIWFLPDRQGHAPGYEQKAFSDADKRGRLCLVAAGDGRDGAVSLHRDADIYAGLFDGAETAAHSLTADRHAWLHLALGSLRVNDFELNAGDGLALAPGESIALRDGRGAEVLLFDMAR